MSFKNNTAETLRKPHTETINIQFTRSTMLSLIIGLVTLSIAGFTGLAIGTTFSQNFRSSAPVQKINPLPTQNAPSNPKPVSAFSALICPDLEWIDCRSPERKMSSECTPEYLARITDYCPKIMGAAY